MMHAPNVVHLINHFNRMSNWVQTEILARDKIEERAAIIKFFIQVGEALVQLQSYNIVMQITAGTNITTLSLFGNQ